MFTLLHDPFYYRPRYLFGPARYSRRQSLFERYLDTLDQRFLKILTEDASTLLGLEKGNSERQDLSVASKSTPSSSCDSSRDSGDCETSPTSGSSTKSVGSSGNESASTTGDSGRIEMKVESRVESGEGRSFHLGEQYISHTQSMFNGRDYIEEHREKVTGSDGMTRIATRRRLGDRWYEDEVQVDKSGEKTEREMWHNVSDEDIESFKAEWSAKQARRLLDDSKVVARTDDSRAKGSLESDSGSRPE
jgi:hypothetical protein